MTDNQIRTAIRLGWPFFATTSRGETMARYVLVGPVFCWQKNQMVPTALQGDDLLWWLQSSEEDDHPAPAGG